MEAEIRDKAGCAVGGASGKFKMEFKQGCMAEVLADWVRRDGEIKSLLEKAIAQGAEDNPNPETNPGKTLPEFLEFIRRCETAMPWDVLPKARYSRLYTDIDQAMGAFYFIFDQPLEELKDRGYYYPCLEYHEPIASWIGAFVKSWGMHLDSPESWKPEYLDYLNNDEDFGLAGGDYESPENWRSFNDFFARRLSSASARPLGTAELVAPADSHPEGLWAIDRDGKIVSGGGVRIKSEGFNSLKQLLGPFAEYAELFCGGTMTHCFLDIHNYHRYHFPIDGTIKAIGKIPGFAAPGGAIYFDRDNNLYRKDGSLQKGKYTQEYEVPGWQSIETRGCIILETAFGPVGILPVGMCQVSSVNFEEGLAAGKLVHRLDPMGCFKFGGSDIIMLFSKKVEISMVCGDEQGGYKALKAGENYARLSIK